MLPRRSDGDGAIAGGGGPSGCASPAAAVHPPPGHSAGNLVVVVALPCASPSCTRSGPSGASPTPPA